MPYPGACGRCRVSQSTVRRPTASSAPGSSKKCVAARNDRDLLLSASSVSASWLSRMIGTVSAAYYEKRRRTHIGKTIREIRSPAPRHHRVHVARFPRR